MSRCFITDPVCGFDFGHNPQQLIYYTSYFQARGFDTIPVCAYSYPKARAAEHGFQPGFCYYYGDYMPLQDDNWVTEALTAEKAPYLERVAALAEHTLPVDEAEALAIADWLHLFERYDVTADDNIFIPSVDSCGTIGFLKATAVHFAGRPSPNICLRFIGVMENATKAYSEPLRPFRVLLRNGGANLRVRVVAESPLYARYLQRFFRRPVEVSLYPLKAEPLPMRRDGPFVVFSAGSGREDKGFFRLLQIARRYVEKYPEDDVVFVTQAVQRREEKHHPYEMAQMIAAPNITLLPPVLSKDELSARYAESHLLIAPYDFETYRLRGSAVVQEGVAKGRPILLTAHTGFHELANVLPTLHNCGVDDDFCDRIHAYHQKDRAAIEAEAHETARRYETRSFASIDTVFSHVEARAPARLANGRVTAADAAIARG